jgi:hypothetical protein
LKVLLLASAQPLRCSFAAVPLLLLRVLVAPFADGVMEDLEEHCRWTQ